MIIQKRLHNPNDFSVNRQEITQTAEERMIQVAYTYIMNIKKDFAGQCRYSYIPKEKEI
jgi:hypothetical protein